MHATAIEQIMGDSDKQAPFNQISHADGSTVSSLNAISILEEDLALSSSTLVSGASNRSPNEVPAPTCSFVAEQKIVYLNEDAMDCVYNESNDTLQDSEVMDSAASPEMFGSDTEDGQKTEGGSETIEVQPSTKPQKKELSQAELVEKSDNYLLARIHESLSGVPPPPSLTISQVDCYDFLRCIQQNRHLFWSNNSSKQTEHTQKDVSTSQEAPEIGSTNAVEEGQINSFSNQIKSGSRNLMNAFNACDLSNDTTSGHQCCIKDSSDSNDNDRLKKSVDFNSVMDDSSTLSTSMCSNLTFSKLNESRDSKIEASTNESEFEDKRSLLNYITLDEKDAINMQWPQIYHHKGYGIHYNRNKYVEDFEYLTVKLCERYVGAETHSTCNVWFTKQAPGSARKRRLLGRRNLGQSPGKRLSHLARRRRTFSSANLQGLGHSDKKQLVLDVKKPILKKGKSPRGKSPRGKSPRGKSPHNSAKKRAARRLLLEGTSPRKTKLETSKRALFQSPPGDSAGPSRLNAITMNSSMNPQKIKRALFPTPKKKEEGEKRVTFEDTKKRKSEEDLEGPRPKWAKSLSFDCPRDLENKPVDSWKERHSTGSVLSRSEVSSRQGRCELSETHKKKLLWAVAEALRGKGITMGHPQFKQYASLLARTVKKFMPDLENKNIPRKSGSTSDRMLKLAKQYVLTIVDTKPANS